MALDRCQQEQLTVLGEDGREHIEVREVSAPVVGIVGDEHVAGVELTFEELETEPDRQRRAQHELRDADRESGEASLRVEDRGVPLVALIQDRRRRRVRHERGHLEADGLHRRADHLRRDGIDLGCVPFRRRHRPQPLLRGTTVPLDLRWICHSMCSGTPDTAEAALASTTGLHSSAINASASIIAEAQSWGSSECPQTDRVG